MLIAQLTDTHIKRPGELAYGQVDTASFLRAAIAHLNALTPKPDLVLMTGDLTDHGTPEQMEHAAELLAALTVPLLAIPGNHDDRAAFAAFFPDMAPKPRASEAFSYVVDHTGLRLIMLDSSVPGKPHGHLDAASLDLLCSALAERPSRPTVIAIHHPPLEVGIAHMDRQNLHNAAALAASVAGAPHVLAIICGHIHRTIHSTLAGTPVIIAPSPAHAVSLALDPAAPPAFSMEPPAILLHQWQPQNNAQHDQAQVDAPVNQQPFGRLVTHVSHIGDFGPDHPFFDENGRIID